MIRPSDEQPKQGSGAFEDVVTVELSDLENRFYALLRVRQAAGADVESQLALLRFGAETVTSDTGVALETVRPLARWRSRFEGPSLAFEADLQAATPPIDFDDPALEALNQATGMRRYEQLCRVLCDLRAGSSRVRIAGIGRRTHAWGEPSGARFRSLYAVSSDRSVTITAVQPSPGAPHGSELVAAHFLRGDSAPELLAEARLSTIYDATGRPRTAGAELYSEGEEYPRRISGQAILQAYEPEAHLRAASFRWSVDGHPGQGGYQLVSE
jgi:hypothetical protein